MRKRAVPLAFLGLALSTGACHKAEVSFAFHPDAASGVTLDMVVVRYNDGEHARTLLGRDFRRSSPSAVPRTATFETQPGGTLTVDVVLRDDADTLTTGTVDIPIYIDIRMSVDIHVVDSNPASQHVDLLGARVFPMRSAARQDSLWLVWSGTYMYQGP